MSSLSETSSDGNLKSQEGNQSNNLYYSARHYSSKNGLPVKISKEAKETVQECATEFLTFVTSEAQSICSENGRKTITADDVLTGLKNLGFDDYHDMVEYCYKRYKSCEGTNDKKE